MRIKNSDRYPKGPLVLGEALIRGFVNCFTLRINNLGENRPFTRSGHMVRNKLHWDASYAVGLPKQRNSYQSSPTFLCFGSPSAYFASQCNLFRTM